MLPDYLVEGYDIASSRAELLGEFEGYKLDSLYHCLGVSGDEIQSANWYRYVWNRGYIIYPSDYSKIRSGKVYVILYEELDNDETIEAAIGVDEYQDTRITIFGPTLDMEPLEIKGPDRSSDSLYRDVRSILKFLVKMDQYSRKDVIRSVRKSLTEFAMSLESE